MGLNENHYIEDKYIEGSIVDQVLNSNNILTSKIEGSLIGGMVLNSGNEVKGEYESYGSDDGADVMPDYESSLILVSRQKRAAKPFWDKPSLNYNGVSSIWHRTTLTWKFSI